jgi:hypothetical protein
MMSGECNGDAKRRRLEPTSRLDAGIFADILRQESGERAAIALTTGDTEGAAASATLVDLHTADLAAQCTQSVNPDATGAAGLPEDSAAIADIIKGVHARLRKLVFGMCRRRPLSPPWHVLMTLPRSFCCSIEAQ